jgi:hypothetical protein
MPAKKRADRRRERQKFEELLQLFIVFQNRMILSLVAGATEGQMIARGTRFLRMD